MDKEFELKRIDDALSALEREYQVWRENATASGNMATVHQMAGANAIKEKEFQDRRAMLERERMEIVGVSPAVEAYLKHKGGKREPLDFSKLDVLNGTTSIDDSMVQFHGKEL